MQTSSFPVPDKNSETAGCDSAGEHVLHMPKYFGFHPPTPEKISALLRHRISASHCGHLQSWASGLQRSAQGQLLCDPLSLHTFTSGRNKSLSHLFLRIPQPLGFFFPRKSDGVRVPAIDPDTSPAGTHCQEPGFRG